MRTTGLFLIALLILPLVFNSCKRPDYSQELTGIDSLMNEIDNAEKVFLSLDTARLDSISVDASNNINQIKHIYDADTVDVEKAKTVTHYKVLRKIANKSRSQRNEIRNETYFTRNQLRNLKSWMEAKQTPEDSGKYYYNQEKQATMALLAAYESHKINVTQSIQLYDSLNPLIETIIAEQMILQKNK